MKKYPVVKDSDNAIYECFKEEFLMSGRIVWESFIESKDIGLKYFWYSKAGHGYYIIDERKWMLAVLKYGLRYRLVS